MTTDTLTACPTWCTGQHPRNDADVHQAPSVDTYGLTVSTSQHPGEGPLIGVDHGPQDHLTLSPVQAHELGMALVRAADVLRREALR